MGLDESQLRNWRERLLDMLSDLDHQDSRGQQSQSTVTLDQQSVGRLSRMDALQQQAMAKATQARRNQTRLRISTALSRLDDGEYGYCVGCGDEIATGRLEFDPAIPSCVSCARG